MHLKSITVKGFKSFPDRTRLEFGPGISVVVGPNGSGKSNITDAVLWALGEQSPLAVRGQSMQDVIFAGSAGVRSRGAAEVEVVIDNSGALLQSEFAEISITRRLDRSGEGIYRLNGARCRLVDVIEVLSDSGLGKEMHSVISQGRVEGIVHSKPIDRTVLIEEAAGLSKHRKRRHRAKLKLERTQDNLDRALDVEREARSRLRPLKRQAEAAELHARLERQSLELRGSLTADSLRLVRAELADAERSAAASREQRDELDAQQSAVAHRREAVERRLTDHGRDRDRLSTRLFDARSATERISLRLDAVQATARALDSRVERARRALHDEEEHDSGERSRLAELEGELARVEGRIDSGLGIEVQEVAEEQRAAAELAARLEKDGGAKASELEAAERALEGARTAAVAAHEQAQGESKRLAGVEAALERLDALRRLDGSGDGPTLADRLRADEGFEAALAGALGDRLVARVVENLTRGARALSEAGDAGARALVKGEQRPGRAYTPPTGTAARLLDHVHCEPDVQSLLELVLADAWIVERIDSVPEDFEGIAVTRTGVSYHGALRELRRRPAAEGSPLAERGRRDELAAELEDVRSELERARARALRAEQEERDGREARECLEHKLRQLRGRREEALERARRAEWLVEQKRQGVGGSDDLRRRELRADIAAERKLAESFARERADHELRRERLGSGLARDEALLPAARRLAAALADACSATTAIGTKLERELEADDAAGEQAAVELRTLAQSEYDLQARLREAGERLTQLEVRLAQVRDAERATAAEVTRIGQAIGCELSPEELDEGQRAEIEAKLERIERRRERIGPVNPLAEQEYREAGEHVEELEGQRKDLEQALTELRGLIRDTDRRIRESFDETFEIAARNFEEVIQQLFPGGSGRLRLVKPQGPRVVLGGAEADGAEGGAPEQTSPFGEPATVEAGEEPAPADPRDLTPGVEIEVTPAGKATKRLSLLSGGEKSLVALGFLFAVFLARPCPFYILDEVEAALDDRNIDRFLDLVRRFADRSQFIVITHQRRTMAAADVLYGVSMGKDGISKVVSRRLEGDEPEQPEYQESLTEAA